MTSINFFLDVKILTIFRILRNCSDLIITATTKLLQLYKNKAPRINQIFDSK